jgi:hypothetical protein
MPLSVFNCGRFQRTYDNDGEKSMTAIRAIFDGKVFVPQQPLDIPPGTAASVLLSSAPSNAAPKDQTSSKPPRKPLAELAKLLDSLPDNSDLPSDFASEIDHYLYGMPRRGNQ